MMCAVYVDFWKASKMFSGREQDEALHLAVVLTDFLQQNWHNQIKATCSSVQILDCCQSDATSFLLQHRWRGAIEGDLRGSTEWRRVHPEHDRGLAADVIADGKSHWHVSRLHAIVGVSLGLTGLRACS